MIIVTIIPDQNYLSNAIISFILRTTLIQYSINQLLSAEVSEARRITISYRYLVSLSQYVYPVSVNIPFSGASSLIRRTNDVLVDFFLDYKPRKVHLTKS